MVIEKTVTKKQAAEKYNSIVKGLRGQLKGTNVQGFVNFETFDVDDKGNYKKTKGRKIIKPTGFFIGNNKIYLTNDDGKLIIANLNTGKISSIIKIAGDKISQPYVSENDLFLIRNGSIIRFN